MSCILVLCNCTCLILTVTILNFHLCICMCSAETCHCHCPWCTSSGHGHCLTDFWPQEHGYHDHRAVPETSISGWWEETTQGSAVHLAGPWRARHTVPQACGMYGNEIYFHSSGFARCWCIRIVLVNCHSQPFTSCSCSMQPPSNIWWVLLALWLLFGALSVRSQSILSVPF